MIFDVLDRIDFDLQKAVFDNYVLKDGLYVRINDNRVEYFLFKDSKKEDKKQLLFKDLDGNIRANEYEWFVSRDYLSGYLNSNKAIDPPKKKIHSNNYLALFVKALEFTSENKEHFAEKLFDNLKKFNSFTKKQEKEVLEGYKYYIFDEERQKDVEKKKELFLGYFDEIVSVIEENEIKNYIKIFFDEPLEKYEKESEIYYVLKIYNKIDTIREIKGKIYGLSDFNMGLNQKKPYLEHKTRGFSLPFMVEKDKIFEVKKLFDYLKNLKEPLKYEPTATAPGIYLHKHNENDQAVIDDFDILVFVEENLPKKFEYKNYIGLTSDGRTLENREITTFEGIFKLIDEVFYNGNLSNNLYGDVYSKLPNDFQNLIYLTRDLAKNILKRDIDSLFGYLKFGMNFIIYNIRQNRLFKAGEILNLILSIKAYKGENVDIKWTLEKIEGKVRNLEELNSDEWHILSGQVIKYLLDKSKKSDKKADMIEPFLRAGKTKKLKDEIEALYFKYKHEIPLNFTKLNNAIALIMANEENEKVDKEKLLIGLLSENIFYKKEEK
ncbi:hypothetical protein [Caminibacter pacificus]|uniref:CRISPR-associated protein Csh1 n=1 Tax=Caminibacter pacificus TaxID=1424653 RepID=A0AAJ4UYV0_9BACT|nr:hypothetical protein [Caminibacter pacificus]QCI28211.1 hypothetical protein C6V80_04340 [Caminibacter pacificus]ROR41074.1 CRISPR-associated protein Csh1 [Caminibacter pacificus]